MVKKEISSQEGHAAGRDVKVEIGPTNNVTAIHGGTNIIGNQGALNVQISTERKNKPRIVVQPDAAIHITPEQINAMRDLRNEWIALHEKLKKKPLTYAAAQVAINRAAGATTQVLIRKDRYDIAIAHIKQQMAMLSNMKSAPREDDAWRAKKIGAIKTRCKNQFNGVDVYKPYIKKNFQADSLTDLATSQLQKTYSYVMAKKSV